jgi:hypothetical protein
MANTISKVKKLLKQKHGDLVTIDESSFKNMTSPARFIDKEFGEWWAKASGVINDGYRHPKRAKLTQGPKRYTIKHIQKLLDKKHGGLVRLKPETYTKVANKATFIDQEYGEWEAEVRSVLQGHKNPKRAKAQNPMYTPKSIDKVIESIRLKHGHTVTIKPETYKNVNKNATFVDIEYGEWLATPKNVINHGTRHPARASELTKQERLISEHLQIPVFNRLFLGYKPDFKLSDNIYLNCDGLYWHSAKMVKDNKYHFNMRKKFEDNGLRILQILESDILQKTPIVLSILNQVRGNTQYKLNARDLTVSVLNANQAKLFYDECHLMGSRRGITTFGLVDDQGIVQVAMSYSLKGSILKIERFCNRLNTTVRGGLTKLLKSIELHNHGHFSEIHYWVDLRYGCGIHLLTHGFILKRETIGFKWTDFKNTYNRMYCRAKNGKSEASIARARGLYKIWDAGQRLYVKTVSNSVHGKSNDERSEEIAGDSR